MVDVHSSKLTLPLPHFRLRSKRGAIVPANFGSVPMLEGDLMVRVGSEDIT